MLFNQDQKNIYLSGQNSPKLQLGNYVPTMSRLCSASFEQLSASRATFWEFSHTRASFAFLNNF